MGALPRWAAQSRPGPLNLQPRRGESQSPAPRTNSVRLQLRLELAPPPGPRRWRGARGSPSSPEESLHFDVSTPAGSSETLLLTGAIARPLTAR